MTSAHGFSFDRATAPRRYRARMILNAIAIAIAVGLRCGGAAPMAIRGLASR